MNEDKIYPSMVIRSQAETIKLLEKELQKYKEVIDKATNKLYEWGEILNPEFQKTILDILKEVK